MKEVLAQWIQKGIELQIGEELYIPTAHKLEQKDFFSNLVKQVRLYRKLDPVGGSQLRCFMTFRDKRYWVVMKKVNVSPLVGYVKGVDGSVSEVRIRSKELDRIERLKKQETGEGGEE